MSPEEVSQFHLLCEVCENTEIYQSSSADLAIAPRSQIVDRTLLRNGIEPVMFTLSKKQQLLIGNQLHKLLLSRLKDWNTIDMLIDGKISLSDLDAEGRITIEEVQKILNKNSNNLECVNESKRLAGTIET